MGEYQFNLGDLGHGLVYAVGFLGAMGLIGFATASGWQGLWNDLMVVLFALVVFGLVGAFLSVFVWLPCRFVLRKLGMID